MKNLFNLLERFSKVLDKDKLNKESILEVIHTLSKVRLTPENISLKEGVLEIKATPVAKSEIKLKEEAIRGELQARRIFVSRIFYK